MDIPGDLHNNTYLLLLQWGHSTRLWDRHEKAEAEVTGEAKRQRSFHRLREPQPHELSMRIRLCKAALASEAVEVDRPQPPPLGKMDPRWQSLHDRFHDASLTTFPCDLLRDPKVRFGIPRHQVRCDRFKDR